MDIMPWLGHAKKSFYHASNTIEFSTKQGESISLLELCKKSTPPCRLNPFLFNGHLQTFWTAIKGQDIPIYYKRHIYEAEHSAFIGTFAVDFVVPPFQGSDETLPPRTTYYNEADFDEIESPDTKPMIVCLHGLSGGSHEIYLRAVLQPLVEQGWEACVVNSRGCAKSSITSELLYNARSTWDIRQVIKWLRKTFPNRPLFGVGFSLGANILVNVRIVDKSALIFKTMNLISSFHLVVSGGGRV